MPNKSYKWEFKIFSRSGVSEILYEFEFVGVLKPKHLEKVGEIGYYGEILFCVYVTTCPNSQDISYFLIIISTSWNY